ncbi:MAG: hypothetical protein WDW38_003584 [Sanguina aurantia]
MVVIFAFTAGLLFADQNLLAPNLSAAALDFGFDDIEKDEKLGGYIMAAFFVVGAPAALLAGILADKVNRRNLLFIVVVLGEAPCLATYWVTSYWQFFILRTLTGISVGGCFPLIFSLLGDLFPITQRSIIAAVVQISIGAGLAIGQAVSATVGPLTNWRLPFVLVSIPALLVALLMLFTVEEPPRGGFEEALREVYVAKAPRRQQQQQQPPSPAAPAYRETITWAKVKVLLTIRSNWLCIAQVWDGRAVRPPDAPGCRGAGVGALRWDGRAVRPPDVPGCRGVRFLPSVGDYIHVQQGFTIPVATLVILLWGAGGAIGVIAGGAGGQYLYNKRKEYLPLLMGASLVVGIGPLLYLVNAPLRNIPFSVTAFIAILGGAASSVAGPNMRAIILNVNTPETRGLALALQSMSDDVGRGAGPFFVAYFIKRMGRREAFNFASLGWAPSSLLLTCLVCCIRQDEAAMQARLQSQITGHHDRNTAAAAAAVLADCSGGEEEDGDGNDGGGGSFVALQVANSSRDSASATAHAFPPAQPGHHQRHRHPASDSTFNSILPGRQAAGGYSIMPSSDAHDPNIHSISNMSRRMLPHAARYPIQ